MSAIIKGKIAVDFDAIRLDNMSDEKNLQRVYDFCNANPDDIQIYPGGRLRIATTRPAHPIYIKEGDYAIYIMGILMALTTSEYNEMLVSQVGK